MISSCPNCQQQVSIPPGANSAALVRCPLCDGEYPLGDALALAPPELILVEPAVASTSSETDEENLAAIEDEADVAAEEKTGGENEAVVVSEQYTATPASVQLRPRKQKSGLRVFLEVVAGGLAGCLVAYYALAFYYGPQFSRVGLPTLPLPGISWITSPKADGHKERATPPENDFPDSRSFHPSDLPYRHGVGQVDSLSYNLAGIGDGRARLRGTVPFSRRQS